MRFRRLAWLLALACLLAGCGGGKKASAPPPAAPAQITLSSPAFAANATIPTRYTCSGAGASPPLRWSGVPSGTRELTLVVEDPDAGNFVHWIVLRIPPATKEIPAGQPPAGSVETKNSFGKRGWGPPCPPKGKAAHHYVFALYATRAPLGLDAGASPDDVDKALQRTALARGTLTATFGR